LKAAIPDSQQSQIQAASIAVQNVKSSVGEAYSKYNAVLRRFLFRRLDSTEDVDDVAQEVYLRLVRYHKTGVEASLPFLYTIASNLLKDRFRRQRTRAADAHISVDALELAASTDTPEQLLRSKQGTEAFRRVLRTLGPTSRQVFLLHRFRGLTYDEIAVEMDITKSKVKNSIYSALRHFRERLPEYL